MRVEILGSGAAATIPMDCLSYGDLERLGETLRAGGRPVTFAYDGMIVDVP
jgi:hypothetical protein